jgi:hypothetical protein
LLGDNRWLIRQIAAEQVRQLMGEIQDGASAIP